MCSFKCITTEIILWSLLFKNILYSNILIKKYGLFNTRTRDFQQCGILTSVDLDESARPPFKLRKTKYYLASSLPVLEYSFDKQGLSRDCAYVQVGLSLCWLHIPHCLKFHVVSHIL